MWGYGLRVGVADSKARGTRDVRAKCFSAASIAQHSLHRNGRLVPSPSALPYLRAIHRCDRNKLASKSACGARKDFMAQTCFPIRCMRA